MPEPDDDLPDISIGGGHAKIGKFLQSFNRGQDGGHRTTCGLRIDLIEKSPYSLDVSHGVRRKNDHPILRGEGRGNSFP